MKNRFAETNFGRIAAVGLAFVMALAAGCKTQPTAPNDQQITADVQSKIKSESALANQNIQVSVASGVVTLNGTVSDDASRALAANDSGAVPGVKTVINNLTVQTAQQTAAPAPPATQPEPQQMPTASPQRPAKEKHHRRDSGQSDQQYSAPAAPQQVAESAPAPQAAVPAPPPAPPRPVVRQIELPAGTVLPVRITETLNSKDAQANDVFHGSLAGDIGSQGVIAIRQGAPVVGRIIDAKDAAHFKGSALLSLELTQLTANGQKFTLVTDPYSKEGAGRGKNTAEKAGGGAVLGAIIGGLAGGGKGAAIGGLAGAGAGTGINAATRGQQVVIPTETLINFQLRSPITVTVTIPPGDPGNGDSEPQLQHR